MKDCERYENMISALLDGELGEREKAELSAHIASCEHCSALAVAFAAASGALAEGLEEPPAGLHSAIMEKVDGAAKAKRAQSRFLRLRPVIAAAACVAVVVITLLAANRGVQNAADSTGFTASVNTSAAAPEAALYGAAAGGSSATTEAAGSGADNGAVYALDAPMEEPEESELEKGAAEERSLMDTAVAEEAEEDEPAEGDLAAASDLPEMAVEVVAAEEGSFTAKVVSDPMGYFAADAPLVILTDEAVSPGDRVTVRYSSIGVGAESGAYYVTAEEIEIDE